MGKKQPLGNVQKQRPGLDITRFLERRGGQVGPHSEPRQDFRQVVGVRPPGGPASTPGKQFLDNILLSQDADDGGLHVVWASSPTAAFSPQKGAGALQEAASASQHAAENSQASKDGFRRTLIQAVQRAPSDAERQVGDQLPGTSGHESLEQLQARRSSHREASTSASAAAAQAGRQAGNSAGGTKAAASRPLQAAAGAAQMSHHDDQVMQDVLAATDTYTTPAAARPARNSATIQSADYTRPALGTPSVLSLGSKRPLVASAKKAASGNKRRALLDLLDQVELMVKHRGPRGADPQTTQREAPESHAGVQPAVGSGDEQAQAQGPLGAAGAAASRNADADAQIVAPSATPYGHGPDPDLGRPGADAAAPARLRGQSSASRGTRTTEPAGGANRSAAEGPADTHAIDLPEDDMCREADNMTNRAETLRHHHIPTQVVAAGDVAPRQEQAEAAGVATQAVTAAAAAGPRSAGVAPAPSVPWGGWSMPPPVARSSPLVLPEASAASAYQLTPATPLPASLQWPGPMAAAKEVGAAGLANRHHQAAAHPPPLSAASAAATPRLGVEATPAQFRIPSAGPVGSATAPPLTGPSNSTARPPPVPPPTAVKGGNNACDDDDDDALWGDVDVDALVAHVTSRAPSPAHTRTSGGPPSVGAAGATVGSLPAAPSTQATQQQPPPQAPQPQTHSAPPPQAVTMPQQGAQRAAPAVTPSAPPETHEPTAATAAEGAPLSGERPPSDGGRTGGRAAVALTVGPSSGAPADSELLGEREEVHFVVLEVEDSPDGLFKTLRCFNEYKGCEARVYLRDMWADQEVAPGDTVNVVGARTLPGQHTTSLEVSAKEGLLILHPDVLLSGTTICTAMRCTRQSWLQERVAGGPGGEKALIGSMMHELLQRSLRAAMAGQLDKSNMLAEARSILSSNTDKLLESHQDEAVVLAHLNQQLDAIVAWCRTYVTPNAAAPLGGRIEAPGSCDAPTFCRVTEVLDIEESIWAPKYGLKGQLDASLRVSVGVKDPLYNQRTLTGGYASSTQQQPHRPPPHGRGAPQHHAWAAGAAAVGHGGGGGVPATQPTGAHWQPPRNVPPPDVRTEDAIVPFEFKTGKDWHEHRAQVLLYLMLMEDRYQMAVRTGLLWNINKPTMQAVRYAHHELSCLFMHRNHLATYLVGTAGEPPPPLTGSESDRKCDYCSVSATCALYLVAAGAAERGGTTNTAEGQGPRRGPRRPGGGLQVAPDVSELNPVLREKLSSISPAGAAFFAQWVRLVDLEEQAVRANRADMWALSGSQRELVGGCIAQLSFERELPPREDVDGVRFQYLFRRAAPSAAADTAPSSSTAIGTAIGTAGNRAPPPCRRGPSSGGALQEGEGAEDEGGEGLLGAGFAPGDMGLLGVEGRHAAAARVTVADVTRDTITLSCRKELKVAKLTAGATRPPGISSPQPGNAPTFGGHLCGVNAAGRPVTWRLDRDEAASLFAQMRLNLAMLGVPGAGAGWQGGGGGGRNGTPGDASQARKEGHLQQLRKLVIELEPPQQGLACSTGSQMSGSSLSSQGPANAYVRANASRMNSEQLEAVQRVLAMQDYAILLGMPGTGKTTTIVHVLRALVEWRVTILVASYTNSAVDNILLKLVGTSVSFVRLGSAQSVHPGVRPYMPGGQVHPDTSVKGLQDLMSRVNVVGCTCLSVHSPLLSGRTFGVCVLDEASQITLPASLGALALARSFLLVGDHYQLSPLVVSREAAQGGLGISLFRRLSEAHPQAVVTLRSQYRMASDIMALSNTLVYNGRMLCGNDAVANATLHLPDLQALAAWGRHAPQPRPPVPPPSAGGTLRAAWPAGLPLPPWILAVLRPEVRVVFLDTDGVVGCQEVALKEGMVNPGEARVVHALVAALVAAGLAPREIGVASPYKAQVAALLQALAGLTDTPSGLPPAQEDGGAMQGGSHGDADVNANAKRGSPSSSGTAAGGSRGVVEGRGGSGAGGGGGAVEVLTVDKYQGRDKATLLLSFVRCNASRSAGRLLADWQRLNVAITRARTKLLLVGSAATLATIPMLHDMLALLRRNGWVSQLAADCLAALPPLPAAPTSVSMPAMGTGTAVETGGMGTVGSG